MSPIISSGRRSAGAVVAGLTVMLTFAAVVSSVASDGTQAGSPGIRYEAIFQAPTASRGPDLSIEDRAIALVEATPPGERIRFAFRDFNRERVVAALVAAKARNVDVRGVIDGGERTRSRLVPLAVALGPDLVFCGSDVGFALHSCLANDPKYSSDGKSLQHNKFMTFSALADGRTDIVLQTSMNFLDPSQLTYFNDALQITGDVNLRNAYEQYVADMMRQTDRRTNDRYTLFTRSGDDGRNTMFPSPRPQPDPSKDDTIVDRLDEIDCDGGGTIRVANMAFRSERAVIMEKLVELRNAGCDIEVILTNGDGDIIAGLVSAGIEVTPLLWEEAGALRQVRVHNKFWLVDATSKKTGTRTKIAYVGSSNWRGDQQYSDDMLLRVVDDGVFDAYSAYWQMIKDRAFTDVKLASQDAVAPASALTATSALEPGRWHRDDVTLKIAASDGHGPNLSSGLARLHVEVTGAQTSSADVAPPDPRLPAVATVPVSAEGVTTVTFYAVDKNDNREQARSVTIRIDKTPPSLTTTGALSGGCELWPPNGRTVPVGTVSAADVQSGLAAFEVQATSDGPAEDAEVALSAADASVSLRAVKAPQGRQRTYTVTGTARDHAGNVGTTSATCVVPHSQGASR